MTGKRTFIVFGVGRFGAGLCRGLAGGGARVIACDLREERLIPLAHLVEQTHRADSTREEALRRLPLAEAEAAIVAMGNSIQAGILTTSLLKDLEVPYVIARAVSEPHLRALEKVGADQVVLPELDEGRRIVSRLLRNRVRDTISVSEDYSIVEMLVPDSVVGKSLAALDMRNTWRINVIAILRSTAAVDEGGAALSQERVILAGKTDVLQEDDVLIVVGANVDLDTFKELP